MSESMPPDYRAETKAIARKLLELALTDKAAIRDSELDLLAAEASVYWDLVAQGKAHEAEENLRILRLNARLEETTIAIRLDGSRAATRSAATPTSPTASTPSTRCRTGMRPSRPP